RADLSLLRKWTVFYRKGTSAYHLRTFLFERVFYPQYAVLLPSYTDRIHSPGPSGLFHATNFSLADCPIHERTFSIARASRANRFMLLEANSSHFKGHYYARAGGPFPITCGHIQDACRPI